MSVTVTVTVMVPVRTIAVTQMMIRAGGCRQFSCFGANACGWHTVDKRGGRTLQTGFDHLQWACYNCASGTCDTSSKQMNKSIPFSLCHTSMKFRIIVFYRVSLEESTHTQLHVLCLQFTLLPNNAIKPSFEFFFQAFRSKQPFYCFFFPRYLLFVLLQNGAN